MTTPRPSHLAPILLVAAAAGCAEVDDPPPPRGPAAPAAYRAELQRTGDQVTDALADVRAALAPDELADALSDASSALSESAAALDDVRPPRAATAAHAQAVAGTEALARAAMLAADAAESRELCAGRSAVAELSRSPGADTLRTAAKRLRAGGFAAAGLAPRRLRMPDRRPPRGSMQQTGTGRGRLTVRNVGEVHAVVRLVDGPRRLTVFVPAGGSARVPDVQDARYSLYVLSGRDWDGKARLFSRGCRFERLRTTMAFRTTPTAYTTFRLVLGGGGSTPAEAIDPRDMPR